MIYDKNKLTKKQENERKYLRMKDMLKQKYDDVRVQASYEIDTGKAYSKIILSKNGEQFVSDFTKDYGEFDTSKQIEFKRIFE